MDKQHLTSRFNNTLIIGLMSIACLFNKSSKVQAQSTQAKVHYGLEIQTDNKVFGMDVRSGPSLNFQSGDVSGDLRLFWFLRLLQYKEKINLFIRSEGGISYNFNAKKSTPHVGFALRATYDFNPISAAYLSFGIDETEFDYGPQPGFKSVTNYLYDFRMLRVGYFYRFSNDKNVNHYINFEGQHNFEN